MDVGYFCSCVGHVSAGWMGRGSLGFVGELELLTVSAFAVGCSELHGGLGGWAVDETSDEAYSGVVDFDCGTWVDV